MSHSPFRKAFLSSVALVATGLAGCAPFYPFNQAVPSDVNKTMRTPSHAEVDVSDIYGPNATTTPSGTYVPRQAPPVYQEPTYQPGYDPRYDRSNREGSRPERGTQRDLEDRLEQKRCEKAGGYYQRREQRCEFPNSQNNGNNRNNRGGYRR